MCLITFNIKRDHNISLTICANRDEFYNRPALAAHYWEDYEGFFGGRDLTAGGTWFALHTTNGKLAFLTNYREPQLNKTELSRGSLIVDYLNSNYNGYEFLQSIHSYANSFAGFNLITIDRDGLFYYSNKDGIIHLLSDGTYALCNHLLDTPWPKLVTLKSKMLQYVAHDIASIENDYLFNMLHDQTIFEDSLLPDTGVGKTRELFLSPCFINGQYYGTRNSTILRISGQSSKAYWHERIFLRDQIILEQEIKLPFYY